VAELIEYHCPYKVILLDHHATAMWLNKYGWATVSPIKILEPVPPPTEEQARGEICYDPPVTQIKTAGTSMFYDHVVGAGYMNNYSDTSLFVEKARRYDTWEWDTIYKDLASKKLNMLFGLLGRDKFVERFSDNPGMEFSAGEKLLVEVEEERIKNYIKKVSKNVIQKSAYGYNFGLVFAESYISELGNTLCKENTDLDFIMIVNVGGGGISFRGIHDNIDLGVVAKLFGGGGHPKAAGAGMSGQIKDLITSAVILQGGLRL
jgi:oligoribonuclease NrnB/cAMP/cGMP phosphodiesterase (DHH superfamily)